MPTTAKRQTKEKKRACDIDNVHVTRAGSPISYNTAGHAPREESPEYRTARKAMHKIIGTLDGWFFGKEPVQDHHGAGLWIYDGNGWFFLRNLVGIEWSSQFCADPAKIDILRQNAKRLYARFPESFAEFKTLGIDLKELLDTPITDAESVARWTDSICNASVPLPQSAHTGVVPTGAGVHNYPTPVTDIAFFKRDDFELWVKDPDGHVTAVVPTHHRGSGNSELHVIHTDPRSKLCKLQEEARRKGERLILGEDHPLHAQLAKQAFVRQLDNPAKRPKA